MTYWAWSDDPQELPDQYEFRSSIHAANLHELSSIMENAAFSVVGVPQNRREDAVINQRITLLQDTVKILNTTEDDWLLGTATYSDCYLKLGTSITRYLVAASDDLHTLIEPPLQEG